VEAKMAEIRAFAVAIGFLVTLMVTYLAMI